MSFAEFRCFEDSGELQVRTVGAWIPMNIYGMATIICACLRMLAIAVHIIWLGIRGKERYDIIIVDQACPLATGKPRRMSSIPHGSTSPHFPSPSAVPFHCASRRHIQF
jgi:hypothetical protein